MARSELSGGKTIVRTGIGPLRLDGFERDPQFRDSSVAPEV